MNHRLLRIYPVTHLIAIAVCFVYFHIQAQAKAHQFSIETLGALSQIGEYNKLLPQTIGYTIIAYLLVGQWIAKGLCWLISVAPKAFGDARDAFNKRLKKAPKQSRSGEIEPIQTAQKRVQDQRLRTDSARHAKRVQDDGNPYDPFNAHLRPPAPIANVHIPRTQEMPRLTPGVRQVKVREEIELMDGRIIESVAGVRLIENDKS